MMTKFNKKDEEGFTLIELLVVILIIGILSAIAIPAFLSQRSKAWEANAKSAARNAALIVEAHSTGNGGNPPRDTKGMGSDAPTDLSTPEQSEWTALVNTNTQLQYAPDASPATSFIICAKDTRLTGGANIAVYSSKSGGMLGMSTTCADPITP